VIPRRTPPPQHELVKAGLATAAPAQTSLNLGSGGGGDLIFNCPVDICDCYLLRPENHIWLNCTVPRLQGTEQQRSLFRGIPTQGSFYMSIT
jgi:hypothetical protein